LSRYYINGKEYDEEQFRQYIENEKQKQLKKLEDIIYQKHYTDVEWFGEITEEQFYKDIKTAYNIMYLTEILDIGCNDKGYRIFNKYKVYVATVILQVLQQWKRIIVKQYLSTTLDIISLHKYLRIKKED